jgi:thymidylate synthase (FAD)
MIFVEPSVEVIVGFPKNLLKQIEIDGRICYKSEEKITAKSSKKFVENLILRGHESVLEHFFAKVRIVCDRGITHEIVRHRIAAYSQESTRYCNYGTKGVRIIDAFPKPLGVNGYKIQTLFRRSVANAAQDYNDLLALGVAPQMARSVLPTALKTEIIVTYNLRQWRHFFRLRAAPTAHPQMQEIAGALLYYFRKVQPALFSDVGQLNHMTNLANLITPEGKVFKWDPTKE